RSVQTCARPTIASAKIRFSSALPHRGGQVHRKLRDDAENELCERKFPHRGSRRALSPVSTGLPLPVRPQEHPTARLVAVKSPLYNRAESMHFVPPRSRPATNLFRFYSSVFSRATCLARNRRVRERNSVAVERHLAQLHAARVGSRRGYYGNSRVQIPITQTECISKWNVESLQRNGELRLCDSAVDANRRRAT